MFNLCSMRVVKENGDQPSCSLPVALVFVIDFTACSSARTDDRRGVNLFPLLCLGESESRQFEQAREQRGGAVFGDLTLVHLVQSSVHQSVWPLSLTVPAPAPSFFPSIFPFLLLLPSLFPPPWQSSPPSWAAPPPHPPRRAV